MKCGCLRWRFKPVVRQRTYLAAVWGWVCLLAFLVASDKLSDSLPQITAKKSNPLTLLWKRAAQKLIASPSQIAMRL